MKRSGKDVPTGVFILAGLFFLTGFYNIMSGLITIMYSPVTTIIYFIIGGLLVICGSWLISLQHRGWLLATIISALYTLLEVAQISLKGSIIAGSIYAIIGVIVLFYLYMMHTKQTFRY